MHLATVCRFDKMVSLLFCPDLLRLGMAQNASPNWMIHCPSNDAPPSLWSLGVLTLWVVTLWQPATCWEPEGSQMSSDFLVSKIATLRNHSKTAVKIGWFVPCSDASNLPRWNCGRPFLWGINLRRLPQGPGGRASGITRSFTGMTGAEQCTLVGWLWTSFWPHQDPFRPVWAAVLRRKTTM